jgi:hypothetical protein
VQRTVIFVEKNEIKFVIAHLLSPITHVSGAFPYGSGYSLQCFFAAGATQKNIFAAIPNARKLMFEFQTHPRTQNGAGSRTPLFYNYYKLTQKILRYF